MVQEERIARHCTTESLYRLPDGFRGITIGPKGGLVPNNKTMGLETRFSSYRINKSETCPTPIKGNVRCNDICSWLEKGSGVHARLTLVLAHLHRYHLIEKVAN